MADLTTNYLGLKLKNPVILGASNLVNNPERIAQAEEAGVAAIVYKSLFEEQIQLESLQLEEELHEYEERNAEMTTLFPHIEHAGPKEHLYLVKQLKKQTSVPVIASLNAIYEPTWIDYAKELEQTGIDALELNLYAIPNYFEIEGKKTEERQLQIVSGIKKAVHIPISVKLSPFYSNMLNFIKKLDERGVDGFVIFNRFFQPDIDIEKENFYYPWELSPEKDFHLPLRYAGLLYGNVEGSICASRGISDAGDAVKMLLAGADCIQMVSAIYRHNPSYIATVIAGLSDWMDRHNYKSIDDFKGRLSRKNLKDPFSYQRAQYVDILMNSEEIFLNHPMK